MRNSIKQKGYEGIKAAGVVAVGMFFAVVVYTYIFYVEKVGSDYLETDMLDTALQQLTTIPCITLGVVFSVFGLLWMYKGDKIGKYLYKYRYLAAGAVFILCIVFEINGSSIQHMSGFLGSDDTGVLLGQSRGIRSDEWAVLTPMMLSQYQNASGAFPYFSETVRGTLTDVFLVYGQPVADWPVIFRPFYLGYLFLSPGKGLAFFWCGRFIALFMASFEFGMLITKKRKGLSVLYALMILWAPVVQWWFAINGLVEMLIFSQMSIVLLTIYMKRSTMWIRLLCIAGVMLCGGGFILTMYPAWQVPVFYLLLAGIVWSIWENYKECRMKKRDWLIILVAAVIFAGLMGAIFYRSRETIETMFNTAYPGKRISKGGSVTWSDLFLWIGNIWFPMFGEGGITSSVVEDSQFFSLFPISCILPAVLWFGRKVKDKLIAVLAVVSLLLGIYCVAGFPKILAQITFLSYSPSGRTFVILQWAGIIILFRALGLMKKPCSIKWAAGGAVSMGILTSVMCYSANPEYFTVNFAAAMLGLCVVLFYCLFRYPGKGESTVLALTLCAAMFLCGALVNPVRSGIDNVYEIPVLQEVKKIHEEDPKALWAVEGMGMPHNNGPIMVGAPTINSTNTYPDLERWEKLDPKKKYQKYYNRYSQIFMQLKQEGDPVFSASQADQIKVELTLEDMQTLDVEYILTQNDLETLTSDECKAVLISQIDSYKIYRIDSINNEGE